MRKCARLRALLQVPLLHKEGRYLSTPSLLFTRQLAQSATSYTHHSDYERDRHNQDAPLTAVSGGPYNSSSLAKLACQSSSNRSALVSGDAIDAAIFLGSSARHAATVRGTALSRKGSVTQVRTSTVKNDIPRQIRPCEERGLADAVRPQEEINTRLCVTKL